MAREGELAPVSVALPPFAVDEKLLLFPIRFIVDRADDVAIIPKEAADVTALPSPVKRHPSFAMTVRLLLFPKFIVDAVLTNIPDVMAVALAVCPATLVLAFPAVAVTEILFPLPKLKVELSINTPVAVTPAFDVATLPKTELAVILELFSAH